jgi:CheY-like chemotaxis protein
MDPGTLLVAVVMYIGSAFIRNAVDKPIQDACNKLYALLKVVLKDRMLGAMSQENLRTVLEARSSPADLAYAREIFEKVGAFRRARFLAELIRGSQVLWVDDNPDWIVYECQFLRALGVETVVVRSTEEAFRMLEQRTPDLIISDIKRGQDEHAGLKFLDQLLRSDRRLPLIFYVAKMSELTPNPPGAFAITNRPDELLHYILDVLERVRL